MLGGGGGKKLLNLTLATFIPITLLVASVVLYKKICSFAVMKCSILLTLLFTFFFIKGNAERIDEAEARSFASAFLNIPATRAVGDTDLRCVANLPAGYVFATPETFVLVGESGGAPIALGYGMKKAGDAIPPVLSMLLQQAKTEPSSTDIFLQPGAPAGPLLTMVRHQKSPYNAACPYYKDDAGTVSEERCVVGCVATALEEILTYYRREIVLQDTLHGWETPHYKIADVLPGTKVDTRLILDNYDTQAATPEAIDAVARLSLYCGMAARMNWGLSESGASVHRLAEPLKRAFGYGFVHYADSYRYAPQEWVKMIANEVREGRPVLYAGYTQFIQGHAFVIDGIDAEGFFHVNWGYGGSYDGYFRMDVLAFYEDAEGKRDDTAVQGFFCNQEALLLHPDAIYPALPDTLVRTGLELAVDSIFPLETPRAGMYTPVAVAVRNTTDATLTSPFELFTNAPTDTLMFEQADFIALTGVTLAPREARQIVVHTEFTETGHRLLRLSPDDIQVLRTAEVEVLPYASAALSHTISSPSFPTANTVEFSVTSRNSVASASRSGVLQSYFLDEGTTCRDYSGAYQQSHVLYLQPGEARTDTITFTNLKPATTYTFKVKYRWHAVGEVTFTTPAVDGIASLEVDVNNNLWYHLDGRCLYRRPQAPGIYIHRGKKVVIRN